MSTEVKQDVVTRQQIEEQISSKKDAIQSLNMEIKELEKQWYLTSDSEQRFEEKMETHTFRENRKKVKKEMLVGRIHWREGFTDEDTGNIIYIERSQIVRVDGVWQI